MLKSVVNAKIPFRVNPIILFHGSKKKKKRLKKSCHFIYLSLFFFRYFIFFFNFKTFFFNTSYPTMSEDYKVVIAFDFGTTFSGASYGFVHDPSEIYDIQDWYDK
jgi:hypothetical protein